MIYKHIRKTKTDAALNEAFWKLYAQKPITRITIREICQEANINRSSFYGHYEDIYDLQNHCEQILLDDMAHYLDFRQSQEKDLSPLDIIIQYYQKNLDKLTLLMGEHGDPSFLINLKDQIIPTIMKHLTIDPNNKEIYYILDFVVTAIITFLTTWYRREKSIPSAKIVEEIRDTILNGCKSKFYENAQSPAAFEKYIKAEEGHNQ